MCPKSWVFPTRIWHTSCALVTGVQTCGLPICREIALRALGPGGIGPPDEGNRMFDTKTVSIGWGGKTLTLETSRVARQADGAVLATLGETVVLCAVPAAKSVEEGRSEARRVG